MRNNVVILAIAATLTSGASALAGNYSSPAEEAMIAPAAAFDWTGGYVGLQFGILDANIDVDGTNPEGQRVIASPDADGMEAGVYVGHNWQGANGVVYGIEGEVNWADADGSADGFNVTLGADQGFTFTSDVNATAALRGRIGYPMDRTMLYAAAGLAYIDFEGDILDPEDERVSGFSDSRFGWTVGVGAEHAFGERWVGRVDYRYSDYGNSDVGDEVDVDIQTHELRLGVAMRF